MSIRPRQVEMLVASQTAEPLGASDRLLEIIFDVFSLYSKSLESAHRAKTSITRFLTGRLRLRVNEEKSAVRGCWNYYRLIEVSTVV